MVLIGIVQVLVPLVYSMSSFICSVGVISVSNGTSARYVMDGACFGPIVNGIAGAFFITGIIVLICYMVMVIKMVKSDQPCSSMSTDTK